MIDQQIVHGKEIEYNFRKIKKQLEKLDYSLYLNKTQGILFCGINDENGKPILDSTSQITVKNNLITHKYFDAQVPIYNVFESESKLISFIKEKYVLDKILKEQDNWIKQFGKGRFSEQEIQFSVRYFNEKIVRELTDNGIDISKIDIKK